MNEWLLPWHRDLLRRRHSVVDASGADTLLRNGCAHDGSSYVAFCYLDYDRYFSATFDWCFYWGALTEGAGRRERAGALWFS